MRVYDHVQPSAARILLCPSLLGVMAVGPGELAAACEQARGPPGVPSVKHLKGAGLTPASAKAPSINP
jgi:hypothetical protein